MKIEIYLSQHELQSRVIQALSDAQLLDKVELRIQPDLYQEKRLPPHGLTTIRNCHVERRADNTLACSACGQKLPSTQQGDFDMDQVANGIALRQW